MEFQNVLDKRYSVRKFGGAPVEEEKLAAVLEAGRTAPTAGNKQPHRVIVARGPEASAKIDACTTCRYGAPVALVVCYDKNECWTSPFNDDNSGHVDTSIVTTYMMLKAEDLGLGTVWVLRFDPAATVVQFKLPDNIVPVSMLMLGYPAEGAEPADRHFQRFPMEHMLVTPA